MTSGHLLAWVGPVPSLPSAGTTSGVGAVVNSSFKAGFWLPTTLGPTVGGAGTSSSV